MGLPIRWVFSFICNCTLYVHLYCTMYNVHISKLWVVEPTCLLTIGFNRKDFSFIFTSNDE